MPSSRNMSPTPISLSAPENSSLSADQVRQLVADTCRPEDYQGKRIVLIIPDGTRTAPIGLMFKTLHEHLGAAVAKLDVMIALGTHPPMTPEAIDARVEITAEQRNS
jgi:lactate racemase